MEPIFTRIMLNRIIVCMIWVMSRTNRWKHNTKETILFHHSHYWWLYQRSWKWKSRDSLNGGHCSCLCGRKTNERLPWDVQPQEFCWVNRDALQISLNQHQRNGGRTFRCIAMSIIRDSIQSRRSEVCALGKAEWVQQTTHLSSPLLHGKRKRSSGHLFSTALFQFAASRAHMKPTLILG